MNSNRPIVDMSDINAEQIAAAPSSTFAPFDAFNVPLHPDSHQPVDPREAAVIEALKKVFDPEIPVNIYDLGLIYSVNVADDGKAHIRMSLTAPGCPVAGTLPGEVGQVAETVDGVTEATVELVWEPGWEKDRMSEDAKLALGFY